MALLEIYTAQNQPMGITKSKAEAHRDGDWHRTSGIFVLNTKDEILLSLRHPAKKYLPNLWAVCVGGHVEPGETYEQCAIREIEEEIGVKPQIDELHFLGVLAYELIDEAASLVDREHAAVYVFRTNRTLDQFVMQSDEVAGLQFIPLHTVLDEFRSDKYSFFYTPPQATYRQTLEMVTTFLNNTR